jgi:hypothetical protein
MVFLLVLALLSITIGGERSKALKVQWSFFSLLVCFLTFRFSHTKVIGYTWLIWLYITHQMKNNNDGLALFRGCRREKSNKKVLVSIFSLSLIYVDAWYLVSIDYKVLYSTSR